MEKPLVCKTPQVLAFLDGATQFRMPVVPQPRGWSIPPAKYYDGYFNRFGCTVDEESIKPKYQPGDVLYVKETWARDNYFYSPESGRLLYKATEDIDPDYPVKWRSPVTMPREYARILLLVKDARVERVQDISREDEFLCNPPHPLKVDGFAVQKRFPNWWNSLYPKYNYTSNPYCFVYAVERTTNLCTSEE